MIAPALLVSVAVPLVFLMAVRRLDLYATDRFDMVVASFVLGLLSFVPAYVINTAFARAVAPTIGVAAALLLVRTVFAPILEEVVKSVGTAFTIWHRHFSYIVDGAIYGFAAGTGFAIIENVSYVRDLGADAGLALSVNRAFSTSLMHGTAAALVGVALGRFRFSRTASRRLMLPLGWLAAIAVHMLFNRVVTSSLPPAATLYTAIAIGLAGLGFIAWVVSRGLAEERRWLHETLEAEQSVSEAEMEIAEHMVDLHVLLRPIGERFGHAKQRQVEALIHLDAQLGLTEEAAIKTPDPTLQGQLEADADVLRAQIDDLHRDVGAYCMTYVRSIHPDRGHAVWERVRESIRYQGADFIDTVHRLELGAVSAVGAVEHVIEDTVARFERTIEAAEQAEGGEGAKGDETEAGDKDRA